MKIQNYLIFSAIVALSILALLGYRLSRKVDFQATIDPTHNPEYWFDLHGDLSELLAAGRNHLAKGSDFSVKIREKTISISRLTEQSSWKSSSENISYYISDESSGKDDLKLTGWLILRKYDPRHADIVFRQGFLQLKPSSIAICVDNYEVGDIEWTDGVRELVPEK